MIRYTLDIIFKFIPEQLKVNYNLIAVCLEDQKKAQHTFERKLWPSLTFFEFVNFL